MKEITIDMVTLVVLIVMVGLGFAYIVVDQMIRKLKRKISRR